MAPLFVVLYLVAAQGASSDGPQDATSAVALAENAFKFRDFGSVTKILDPWLHPPKIIDKKLLVEARKLLGVSLHVLGREKEAREEFGQLLLTDPEHQLDPFVIPPNVIVTFEAVRKEMKPTLDRITGKTDPPDDELPGKTVTKIELVEVPSMATMFLPGGVPQFLLSETGWGAMWLTIQVAALVLNIVANRRGATPNIEIDEYRLMVALQYTGIAAFLGSWAGSSIQGLSQLNQLRATLTTVPTETPADPATTFSIQLSF